MLISLDASKMITGIAVSQVFSMRSNQLLSLNVTDVQQLIESIVFVVVFFLHVSCVFRRAPEEEAPGEGRPQRPSAAGDQPPAGGGHDSDLKPAQRTRGRREETQRD